MNAIDVPARGLASRAVGELGLRQVAFPTLAAAKSLDLQALYGNAEIVIRERESSRWTIGADVVDAQESYSWFRDAAGTIWRLTPTQAITPFMLGASPGGDSRYPLQFCLDYAAANGTKAAIHARFQTSYPIYLPARGCVVDGTGGWIVNTNVDPLANVQQKLCLIPGNYSAQYYGSDVLDFHSCEAVSCAGQGYLVIANTDDANGFAPGDIVFIRSAEFYYSADQTELPLYGSFNEVAAIDSATGRVDLAFPIKDAVANPLIAVAERGDVPDILQDRGLYVCVRATIVGGLSLESAGEHCWERGGTLGCDFEFGTLRSKTGIFTNGICFSQIRVRNIEADQGLLQLGACSTAARVEVRKASYRKSPRSVQLPLITVNENALACSITLNQCDFGDYDYLSQPAISIAEGKDCDLTIDRLDAPGVAGPLCLFINYLHAGAGESQPVTRNMRVKLGQAKHGPAVERIGYFRDLGGRLDGCYFEAHAEGEPITSNVTLAGSNHVIRGSYGSANRLVSLNTSIGCDIDVVAAGVVGFTGNNAKRVVLNGVDQYARPKRRGFSPGTTVALSAAAPTIVPDFSVGGDKSYSWAGASAVTVADPLDAFDGEIVEVALTNANATTAVAPDWGASYVNTGAVAAIEAGKTTLLRMRKRGARIVVTPLAQNYSA